MNIKYQRKRGGSLKKKNWNIGVVFLIIFFIVGIVFFQAGLKAGAASSQPGSSGDPLITKSYLDQRLSKLDSEKQSYEKVTVKKGKTLTASAGTELIVYRGSGTITGSSGLLNLSSGELFEKGTSIVLYSLYFSPASSSGITAGSELTVFIRGGYQIK